MRFSRRISGERAFTLIEVMIASGILFLCLFAILGVLGNTLRNARALRRTTIDAGTVAAYFAGSTNRVVEGIESGNFDDLGDFADRYRDFDWHKETQLAETNGIWLEIYTVRRKSTGQIESVIPRRVYDPMTRSKNAMTGVGPVR